jgi:hypothetical protein
MMGFVMADRKIVSARYFRRLRAVFAPNEERAS